MMEKHDQKISFLIVLFLTLSLITSFTLTPYSGFASTENNNNTLIEPEASQVCQQQTPPLLPPISF